MPSDKPRGMPQEVGTTPPDDADAASELTPDELDVLELPERHALSMFTGGIGTIKGDPFVSLEPRPPADVISTGSDPSSET
jgi:hypothetical protein